MGCTSSRSNADPTLPGFAPSKNGGNSVSQLKSQTSNSRYDTVPCRNCRHPQDKLKDNGDNGSGKCSLCQGSASKKQQQQHDLLHAHRSHTASPTPEMTPRNSDQLSAAPVSKIVHDDCGATSRCSSATDKDIFGVSDGDAPVKGDGREARKEAGYQKDESGAMARKPVIVQGMVGGDGSEFAGTDGRDTRSKRSSRRSTVGTGRSTRGQRRRHRRRRHRRHSSDDAVERIPSGRRSRSLATFARGGPAALQNFLEIHRPAKSASTARPTAAFTVASTIPPEARKCTNGGEPSTKPCRVEFADGRAYEGPLGPNGMPQGWGILVLPTGGGEENAVCEGNWLRGRLHGRGALRLPNGNAYWGSWSNGLKHGEGTFVWADGSRYEGCYRAGRRSGMGSLRYADGATYTGHFECDVRHGSGCLVLPDGSSYDGQWAADYPHGHGVYIEPAAKPDDPDGIPGGERYEGSWNKGVRSGGGTLVQGYEVKHDSEEDLNNAGTPGTRRSMNLSSSTTSTAWYSGNFEAGLPHGDGVMGHGLATFCGHVEQGVWTGGGGRVDLGDGNGSFEGSWSNGLPRGRGRWCGSGIGGAGDPRSGVHCSFKEGHAKLIWPG